MTELIDVKEVNEMKIAPINKEKGEKTMSVQEFHEQILGMKGEKITLEVTVIKRKDIFRCRVQRDAETIEKYTGKFLEYKEALDKGENPKYPFTPIKVQKDGENFNLLGGDHRLVSAGNAGLTTIQAIVYHCTEEEALMIAMTDNRENALPMSNGDYKFCIERIRERHPDRTSGVIADILGCSRQYVDKIDTQLATSCNVGIPEKRRGKDGKMYSSKRKSTTKQPRTCVSEVPNSLDEVIAETRAYLDDKSRTLSNSAEQYAFHNDVIEWLQSKRMQKELTKCNIRKGMKFH